MNPMSAESSTVRHARGRETLWKAYSAFARSKGPGRDVDSEPTAIETKETARDRSLGLATDTSWNTALGIIYVLSGALLLGRDS